MLPPVRAFLDSSFPYRSNAVGENDDWIRLPEEGTRCPHTGLSRSCLRELVMERHPVTGEYLVESVLKKKTEDATRGVFLIRLISLRAHLQRLSDRQRGLRWANHVGNPHGYSLSEVLTDPELFALFLGPENTFTENDWREGKLASREQRILALRMAGALILDDSRGGRNRSSPDDSR